MSTARWLAWLFVGPLAAGCLSETSPARDALDVYDDDLPQSEGTGNVLTSLVISLRPADGWAEVDFQGRHGKGYATFWEKAQPTDVRTALFDDADERVVLPFLEPERSYEVEISIGEIVAFRAEFTTVPGTHQWAAPDEARIFPGTRLEGGCTMAFILRDGKNGTLYGLTAGHCLPDVGTRMGRYDVVSETTSSLQFAPLGVVAMRENDGGNDWGLIRIDTDQRHLVSPAVHYWSGPAGEEPVPSEGSIVCVYGWGGTYNLQAATRHRCGEFANYWEATDSAGNAQASWWSSLSIYDGDSGSPVILHETGQAIGIVGLRMVDFVGGGGMTICAIGERLDATGWELAMPEFGYVAKQADPAFPHEAALSPGPRISSPCL